MMNELKKLVDRHGAKTRPAAPDAIHSLEAKLGFSLAPDYANFLSTFGVIVHGSMETYGLGVPETYYLHVLNSHTDLSRDPQYPPQALPLFDVGDGRYYLYDNKNQQVVLWATPNGGIVKAVNEGLEAFLSRQIFGLGNTV